MRPGYFSLLVSALVLYGFQIQSALARVDTVRTFPEERYLTGANGFNQHLMRTLRYPLEAQQAAIVGTSLVSITLTPSGKLTLLTIVNSLGKAIDNEVTKAIQATAKLWLPVDPAELQDSLRMILPVTFSLGSTEFYVEPVKPDFILTGLIVIGYNRLAFIREDKYFVNQLSAAFAKKDSKRMLKMVDELIRRNPYSDKLYFQRAKIEQELGLTEEACSDYKKIVYFLGRTSFPKQFLQNCPDPLNQRSSATTSIQPAGDSPIEEQIFTVVERPPTFPGGSVKLKDYIQQNLRYPEVALTNKVQGKVLVSFIVTDEGGIQDVNVLKGPGYGIDQEAVRLVYSMPNWNPGKQSGRPVHVKYILAIPFTLNGAK